MKLTRRLLRTCRLAASFLVLGGSNLPESVEARTIPGQLLVKCVGGPASAAARAADAAVGSAQVRCFNAIGWHLVRLPEGLSVSEAMAKYRAQPGVLAVEPNAAIQFEPPPPKTVAAEVTKLDSILDFGFRISNMSEWSLMSAAANGSRASLITPHSPLVASPTAGVIPNDPRFKDQWNLRIIGMTNAWAVTTGSTNVVVAVVDTGVDYTHDDLRDNMWRNPGETGLDAQGRDKATNGIDDDGNGYVDDLHGIDAWDNDADPMDEGTSEGLFHGTACAGIIGASGGNGKGVTGINWAAKIMALRAGRTVLADRVLSCWDYVLTMKRKKVNVRVLNFSGSIQFNFSEAVADAARRLGEDGILLVAAASNHGIDTDSFSLSPAHTDSPWSIAVAASTRSDTLISYSNFGLSTVDLAAPTEVWTASKGSTYISDFPGTSAACPHVSGAAALLWAAVPTATTLQVKAALMQSVDQKPAFRGKVASNGRLNVARALEVIANTSLPAVVVGAFPASSRARQEAPIELRFNKPMDRASVETSLEFKPPITGTFEWSDGDRVLRLRHAEPFIRTNYTCRLLGSARDASGASLDGDFSRSSDGSPTDDFLWGFRFAPENDDLESAFVLSGVNGSAKGTTRNSSSQVEEALANGFNFNPLSVWYSWTAPQTGWVTFEAAPAGSIDLIIAAYAGKDFGTLSSLAINDNDGTRSRPRPSWFATQGRTYSVDVAGKVLRDGGTIASGSGDFTLTWYPTPPPGITSFSPGTAAPGATVTLNGTNFTGVTRVLFGGVEAKFTALTNTHNFYDLRLTAVVPAKATTGPITIETPHGNFTTATSFEVIRPDPPVAVAILRLANGQFQLSAPTANGILVLESTGNLAPPFLWTPIWTNPASRPLLFTDPDAGKFPHRFYRAVGR